MTKYLKNWNVTRRMEWGEDGSHKPLNYALIITLLSGTMKQEMNKYK